jgi:hypothetical protein
LGAEEEQDKENSGPHLGTPLPSTPASTTRYALCGASLTPPPLSQTTLTTASPPPTASQLPDNPSNHSLDEARAVVATLRSGTEFITALHDAVPLLEQLLASPAASDVQAAIQLLKLMHFAGVQPADAALHKMVALVFSKDAAIRTSVLDAFVDLHLSFVCPPPVDACLFLLQHCSQQNALFTPGACSAIRKAAAIANAAPC